MQLFPHENYLFVENVIVEKLQKLFLNDDPEVKISVLGDINHLLDGNYYFPSLNVYYLGDTPLIRTQNQQNMPSNQSLGSGRIIQVTQHWAVILAVKDASDPKTNSAVREKAGKYFLRVLVGLQGFEVVPYRPLIRVPFNGFSAQFITGGHAYLTAQFDVTFDIVGEAKNG
jgi:hypothetical protein